MSCVLRGATVIDGTGAPGRTADVLVEGDRIVAVGDVPATEGVEEIDLTGMVLCPGFIDVHTHFDAQVFWDPQFTPSSWHGVTTVVQGNCGFGIAPMRPEDRFAISDTLARVEGMSLETLNDGIDWSFETFPEYMEAIRRAPKMINLATFVGHTPIRMYVMGADDSATREATPEEIATMKQLVAEALEAGAIGFSTSHAPSHVGTKALPVPSRLASHDEMETLIGTVGEVGHGVVEMTYGPEYPLVEAARISKKYGVRITWGSLLTGLFGQRGTAMDMLEKASAVGGDVWPQVSTRYITTQFQLRDALLFWATLPAFREVLADPDGDCEKYYRDPEWRARARAQAYSSDYEPAMHPITKYSFYVEETTKHTDLKNIDIEGLAKERGVDMLDLMLDLALEENLETRFGVVIDNNDPVELAQLLTDRRTLWGAHDAGAHVDTISDSCYTSHVLGHFVREEGLMTPEEAIYRMTGQPAEFFGFDDRGVIEEGKVADLVAFDPATVAALDKERVWDFPADGDRIVVRSRGIEHVWVNGEQIRRNGEPVPDATPGQLVS
jgi:N-acyl-D-aspartate/D-glutamate deacylase